MPSLLKSHFFTLKIEKHLPLQPGFVADIFTKDSMCESIAAVGSNRNRDCCHLPVELVELIGSFLDVRSALYLASTCHRMRNIIFLLLEDIAYRTITTNFPTAQCLEDPYAQFYANQVDQWKRMRSYSGNFKVDELIWLRQLRKLGHTKKLMEKMKETKMSRYVCCGYHETDR